MNERQEELMDTMYDLSHGALRQATTREEIIGALDEYSDKIQALGLTQAEVDEVLFRRRVEQVRWGR